MNKQRICTGFKGFKLRQFDDKATVRHKPKQHLITNDNMSKPMQTFTEQVHPKFYNPTHSYHALELSNNRPGFCPSIWNQTNLLRSTQTQVRKTTCVFFLTCDAHVHNLRCSSIPPHERKPATVEHQPKRKSEREREREEREKRERREREEREKREREEREESNDTIIEIKHSKIHVFVHVIFCVRLPTVPIPCGTAAVVLQSNSVTSTLITNVTLLQRYTCKRNHTCQAQNYFFVTTVRNSIHTSTLVSTKTPSKQKINTQTTTKWQILDLKSIKSPT